MPRKRNLWHELCEITELDDDLPCRDSGYWAEDKLWYWSRYIDITTQAMVGKPAWPNGLVYIDLFAGPGICKIRESGRRIPGSPLIAAYAPKPFTKILLCELDRSNAEACRVRMGKTPARGRFKVFHGDCNALAGEVAANIPSGTLSLAFLDPTGLHLQFKTIQTITGNRKTDLLILFPDAVDILRNKRLF